MLHWQNLMKMVNHPLFLAPQVLDINLALKIPQKSLMNRFSFLATYFPLLCPSLNNYFFIVTASFLWTKRVVFDVIDSDVVNVKYQINLDVD